MTRVNLLLLLAVIFSALYLVRVQYESRRLVTEIDRAQADARRLATQATQLELEKRQQATSARVERLARNNLQMRMATPAITRYVKDPAAPAASQASLAPSPSQVTP